MSKVGEMGVAETRAEEQGVYSGHMIIVRSKWAFKTARITETSISLT